MQRSDKIHSKMQDLLAGVRTEEFQQWVTSPCTRALFMKLDMDLTDITLGWQLGNYDDADNHKAQGQAFYILQLVEDIRTMKSDQLAEEKEEDA